FGLMCSAAMTSLFSFVSLARLVPAASISMQAAVASISHAALVRPRMSAFLECSGNRTLIASRRAPGPATTPPTIARRAPGTARHRLLSRRREELHLLLVRLCELVTEQAPEGRVVVAELGIHLAIKLPVLRLVDDVEDRGTLQAAIERIFELV